MHTIFGLVAYQTIVYYFRPYFIPCYMMLILLKNKFYSNGADVINRGLRNNKNSALIASPAEHEIYKRQYELLGKVIEQSEHSDDKFGDLDARNGDPTIPFDFQVHLYRESILMRKWSKLSILNNFFNTWCDALRLNCKYHE